MPTGLRVFVESHGCRLNQAEGDAMASTLRSVGHQLVDEASDADLIVVNGCTVTHSADADARRRVRALHRASDEAAIVVTGCYANMHPDEAAALPGVRAVVGNVEKEELASVVAALGIGSASLAPAPTRRVGALVQLRRGRPRIERPKSIMPAASGGTRTRAYLKVQDGCNYQCSFCIVPQVRGRSRSISAQQARTQLAELVAEGRPEVALTGVHLGTWGWDLGQRELGLAGLVEQLLPALGPSRLRLGSLDPHELDAALVELIATHAPRLCRHLHLPVQSGDDEVLAQMRRAHRSADLSRSVPMAAERVEGLCIGSDIIVGFPGESETAFERSMALFDDLPIHYAHVFAYSPRAGTDAASLGGRLHPDEMKRRSAALRERVARNWQAFRRSQMGEPLRAMVWKRRHRRSGHLVGLTDNYIKVEFEGDDALRGGLVDLEVVDIDGERTLGRVFSR